MFIKDLKLFGLSVFVARKNFVLVVRIFEKNFMVLQILSILILHLNFRDPQPGQYRHR